MSLKMDDVLTPLHMSGKPVGFATEQAVDTLSVDEKARNRSPSEAELASLKVLCESVAASAQKLGQKVSTVKVLTTHGIAVSQPVSTSVSSRSLQASSCSLMAHLSMLPEHWCFQAIFWTSDSTRGSGSDRASIEFRPSLLRGESKTTIDSQQFRDFSDAVKQLNTALMAYPCSNGWDEMLSNFGLEWKKRPLRSQPLQLMSKLERFVDDTSDAIGSSMFSPAGIWASPRAPYFFAPAICLIFAGLYRASDLYHYRSRADRTEPCLEEKKTYDFVLGHADWFCYKNYATTIGYVAFNVVQGIVGVLIAIFLRYRKSPRPAKVLTLLLGINTAIIAVFTCIGVWSAADFQFSKNFPPTYAVAWSLGAVIVNTAAIVVVFFPTYSFYAMFSGAITGFAFIAGVNFASKGWAAAAIFGFFSVLMTCLGVYLLRQRFQALSEAKNLALEDAARYNNLWASISNEAEFREAVRSLDLAWAKAMEGACADAKLQRARDIEELFHCADMLNPLLQSKAEQWAKTSGGRHAAAPVKSEVRALQKVYRSYKTNWLKLCDLVRTALVFETIGQIQHCLEVIASDREIELLKVDDAKQRFSLAETATSGGYRDVQLSLRLISTASVAAGTARHICEVQLHLQSISALKSEGGHKSYVRARNLRGE
jgi:hypothetical protein